MLPEATPRHETARLLKTVAAALWNAARWQLVLWCLKPKSAQHRANITPPECFMGSKCAQNLMLMPNLLLDYVGYILNLCIFAVVVVVVGLLLLVVVMVVWWWWWC